MMGGDFLCAILGVAAGFVFGVVVGVILCGSGFFKAPLDLRRTEDDR